MTDVHTTLAAPTVAPRKTHAPAFRLVLAVVLTIPLNVGWVLWSAPGAADDFNRRITLAPFDLALGALLVVWFSQRRDRLRPRFTMAGSEILAAAFCVVFFAAFVAHPSWRGVEYVVRFGAAIAIIDVVRHADRRARRSLCVAFVGAGAFQSVLAIAQVVHGRGFALYPIDREGPLFGFGDTHAGRGGLSHPYHLAVFLLLAVLAAVLGGRASAGIERRAWMAGAAIIGSGLAITFSRAMIVALVPVAVAWMVERRARIGVAVRPILAALLVGMAISAVTFASGWTARASQTTGSGADRGRVEMARAGIELASNDPFTGVGPARYVIALDERDDLDVELLPSHNVIVHAAAELGVAGAIVVSLIGLWFGYRVVRRGVLAAGALWLLTPFFLLDAYPYVFPTGIALTALWIGVLENRSMMERSS